MNRNTRYLIGLWAFVVLIAALLAVQVGSALWRGDVWLVVLALAFATGLSVVIRWRVGDRRIRRLLQCEFPDSLIAFYKRTIRPALIPDGDALLAHACALAYTLYADYPAARATLQGIDWEERTPLIRACGRSVEALLSYFATRDYERGLELAHSAQETARVPKVFPGARTSAAGFDSLVEIGDVLCNRATVSTIESLERKLSVLPTIGRLLVAWGLAIAYRKGGDDAKAEALHAYICQVAPHCRALFVPPNAQPP